MKEKLENLLRAEENLTRSRFAELLETQPATISHIISGRNKPGFDLIQKILQRFPNINPDWLLLDKGSMLRDESLTPSGLPKRDFEPGNDSEPASSHAVNNSDDAISNNPAEGLFARSSGFAGVKQEATSGSENAASKKETPERDMMSASPAIRRVVILYDDGTCETFAPKL
ncbi:MAG: helix-turn-helix transcriptional regulator [Alistipes sp.]|nr:helix-turn-helix transcriptional regulator [Alistipes sp.]